MIVVNSVSIVSYTTQDPYCSDTLRVQTLSELDDTELTDKYGMYVSCAHEIYLNTADEHICYGICETLDELKTKLAELIKEFHNDTYKFLIETFKPMLIERDIFAR